MLSPFAKSGNCFLGDASGLRLERGGGHSLVHACLSLEWEETLLEARAGAESLRAGPRGPGGRGGAVSGRVAAGGIILGNEPECWALPGARPCASGGLSPGRKAPSLAGLEAARREGTHDKDPLTRRTSRRDGCSSDALLWPSHVSFPSSSTVRAQSSRLRVSVLGPGSNGCAEPLRSALWRCRTGCTAGRPRLGQPGRARGSHGTGHRRRAAVAAGGPRQACLQPPAREGEPDSRLPSCAVPAASVRTPRPCLRTGQRLKK